MSYKLSKYPGVIRLADGACIPDDAGNRDWQDYLVWLAAGHTPEAADPVVAPVARVAKLLIVERLIASGKAEATHAALAGSAALALMWGAAPETVPVDRADIRTFLTAIGADPDVILAEA